MVLLLYWVVRGSDFVIDYVVLGTINEKTIVYCICTIFYYTSGFTRNSFDLNRIVVSITSILITAIVNVSLSIVLTRGYVFIF